MARRCCCSILVAVVLCGLAGLVRSGSHAAWLAAVTFESGFIAVGLFRFAFARYLGGALLAVAVLGTLLHPALARVFAGFREVPDRVGLGGQVLGEGPGELVAGQAVSLFGPFKPAGHMLGMGAGVWSPWSSLRF